jgi:hypothetical protein
MYITEEQALRRFPELRELVTLRQADWKFRLIGNRGKGIDGIVASYSQKQFTDALWTYDQGTIIGLRVLDEAYGGGTVWSKQDGTLPEVVTELLSLPDPDDRLAPRLVKARTSSGRHHERHISGPGAAIRTPHRGRPQQ